MYIMTWYYGQQEHFQTSKVLILENFPRLCCVSRQIFKCTYSSAETWKCYQVKGAQQNHLVHRLRPNFVLTSTYINMGCVSHFCYKNKLSCIISHNYQLSISNYIVKVQIIGINYKTKYRDNFFRCRLLNMLYFVSCLAFLLR